MILADGRRKCYVIHLGPLLLLDQGTHFVTAGAADSPLFHGALARTSSLVTDACVLRLTHPWGTPAMVAYGAGMADLVYPPVIGLGHAVFFALGITFTIEGAENIPRAGGGILASNHVSYLDFTFIGKATLPSKRYVRFMAKDQTFHHRVSGPLMRGMHHIPVDRSAGAAAFDHAVTALKQGEIVGVFPEATISRSFTLKSFKTGAARMATAADVPLIPMATWGGQRLYTKDHKPDLRRGKSVMLAVGEPFRPAPGADPVETTAELHRRIEALLDHQQRTYTQHPAGDDDRWWLPAHLGGTAPTLEQATALDAADIAKKKRK